MDEEQSKLYRPEIVGNSDDILPYYEVMANSLTNNAKIAEIGIMCGRSAVFLSEELTKINKCVEFHCVDIVAPSQFIVERQAFIKDNNLNQTLIYLEMASARAATTFRDEYFDFIFIDADHSYENVIKDIKAWFPKVKSKGIISGHDYYNYYAHNDYPGVRQAVDEFFGADNISHPTRTVWQFVKP